LRQRAAIVGDEAFTMGSSRAENGRSPVEGRMRYVSWLAAAGLVIVTAGCTESAGYPTTYGYSPGYSSPGYGYSSGYYAQPTYYRPAPTYYSAPTVVTQTRYVPVPVAAPAPTYRRMRDSDRDGIPDRYDRDKNGDGVPDKWQRRRY
jgi:hypothetical protein